MTNNAMMLAAPQNHGDRFSHPKPGVLDGSVDSFIFDSRIRFPSRE